MCILKVHCRPGIVLASGDPALNKHRASALVQFTFLRGASKHRYNRSGGGAIHTQSTEPEAGQGGRGQYTLTTKSEAGSGDKGMRRAALNRGLGKGPLIWWPLRE